MSRTQIQVLPFQRAKRTKYLPTIGRVRSAEPGCDSLRSKGQCNFSRSIHLQKRLSCRTTLQRRCRDSEVKSYYLLKNYAAWIRRYGRYVHEREEISTKK